MDIHTKKGLSGDLLTPDRIKRRINAAMAREKADVVLKNAKILNVFTKEFETGDLAITDGFFVGIGNYSGYVETDASDKYIVPGFMDSHMHLESSIVSPAEYSQIVIKHGTTAVVADPHEIANVCGSAGIDYIMQASRDLDIDVFLMLPSCVPATQYDENGFPLDSSDIDSYMGNDNVLGLAEMMNYPGVLNADTAVIDKIAVAASYGKIVDGHAPGISGRALNAYCSAGVYSDHECVNADEAIEKIKRGQWVMIREGTACHNLKALLPLFNQPYCGRALLATDDKHPGDLFREGHIDHIVRKAIAEGADPVSAYCMASYNPAIYFGLERRGAICPGYIADFLVLDDYKSVKISSVYKNGRLVTESAEDTAAYENSDDAVLSAVHNTVRIADITAGSFALTKEKERVIGLVENEILTTDEGWADAVDIKKDIIKLAVIERHHATGHMAVAFLKGFGLKSGAVATTVSHDAHNIITAGVNDEDMAFAVRKLKDMQGGMVVVDKGEVKAALALPIAGLMCELPALKAGEKMEELNAALAAQGVNGAGFMTLSFTSLAVIPQLRLTTKGIVELN